MPNSILRIYDPVECDAAGVPLDWECCRCRDHAAADDATCPFCLDEGSLRAYALKECWYRTVRARRADENHTAAEWERLEAVDRAERPIRCEGCGHPMSEGAWEEPRTVLAVSLGYVETRERGRSAVMRGIEPRATAGASQRIKGSEYPQLQASRRPVDIRTLGWPHDLGPEKLAVLCLRCYAERTSSGEHRTV